jgi:hypothetical protein
MTPQCKTHHVTGSSLRRKPNVSRDSMVTATRAEVRRLHQALKVDHMLMETHLEVRVVTCYCPKLKSHSISFTHPHNRQGRCPGGSIADMSPEVLAENAGYE